jgi:hypothetical protein
MAKTGRPSSYSQEIAGVICDEIATTGLLPGQPEHSTKQREQAAEERKSNDVSSKVVRSPGRAGEDHGL